MRIGNSHSHRHITRRRVDIGVPNGELTVGGDESVRGVIRVDDISAGEHHRVALGINPPLKHRHDQGAAGRKFWARPFPLAAFDETPVRRRVGARIDDRHRHLCGFGHTDAVGNTVLKACAATGSGARLDHDGLPVAEH